MTAKKEYHDRIAAGRCGSCGKPGVPGKALCVFCRDAQNARRLRLRASGTCTCGVASRPGKAWCQRCSDKRYQTTTDWLRAQRQAVYDHYGRICACCGETEPLFLSIDHVLNNGAEQRRATAGRNKANTQMYRDIILAGFPDAYQVLCMNCNCGKHRNGGVCPHKSTKAKMA